MNLELHTRKKMNDILKANPEAINENFDRMSKDLVDLSNALEAYQVDLAADVTGDLPVTNLDGGENASAVSFWRGDGQWALIDDLSNVTKPHTADHSWIAARASTVALGVGAAVASSNAASEVDAAGVFSRCSSAVSGTQCHVSFSNTHCWLDHNPTAIFRIRTGSTIANVRIWIGITAATAPTDSDTQASRGCMFRYSTVAGDGGWIGANKDGSTQSVTAVIAPIAASTEYTLKIELSGDGTLATFTVDENAPVTLATNLGTGTAMRVLAGIVPQTAATRSLDVRSCFLSVPISNGIGSTPALSVLAVANGGTGLSSYTIGDLLYADGATSLAKLAAVATGNVLRSGGVATAPNWGKVDLTAHITGDLPDANLSANVPLKDAANVFSAASNQFSEILTVAKGLAFPAVQVASSDANTLDDYEEGTWTPTIGGAGGESGQAYSSQRGDYIKIGRKVTVWFALTLSTLGTITGAAQIEGLPFASTNVAAFRAVCPVFWIGFTTAFVYVQSTVVGNSTVMPLFGATAATVNMAGANVVQADLNNTSRLVGSFTYETDS